MKERYCSKCGEEIEESTNYCTECGKKLLDDEDIEDEPEEKEDHKVENIKPKEEKIIYTREIIKDGSSAPFICSLLGFILILVPVLGLLLCIVGLATSGASKEGLKTATIVLGVLGLIIGLICLAVVILFFSALAAGIGSFISSF